MSEIEVLEWIEDKLGIRPKIIASNNLKKVMGVIAYLRKSDYDGSVKETMKYSFRTRYGCDRIWFKETEKNCFTIFHQSAFLKGGVEKKLILSTTYCVVDGRITHKETTITIN